MSPRPQGLPLTWLLSVLFLYLFAGPVQGQSQEVVSGDNSVSSLTVETRESQSIPYKQDEAVTGSFVAKAMFALVVLLGLAAGLLYVARRYMLPAPKTAASVGTLELIEMRRLSPKTVLFLVRVRNHEVLLAQHGDSLVVVGDGYEGSAGREDGVGRE